MLIIQLFTRMMKRRNEEARNYAPKMEGTKKKYKNLNSPRLVIFPSVSVQIRELSVLQFFSNELENGENLEMEWMTGRKKKKRYTLHLFIAAQG